MMPRQHLSLVILHTVLFVVLICMLVKTAYVPKPLPEISIPVYTPVQTITPSPSPSPSPTPEPVWTITAYTAGFESTGKTPASKEYGITASGTKVKSGDCACDRQYPFGTIFIVEGIGSFKCTDRGGMVKGNHLDLYIPSLKAALQFGKQYLKVSTISEPQIALQSTE